MSIIYNNNEIEKVNFNSQRVDKITVNNVTTVWERARNSEVWDFNLDKLKTAYPNTDNSDKIFTSLSDYNVDTYKANGDTFNQNLSIVSELDEATSTFNKYIYYDQVKVCDIYGSGWIAEEYSAVTFYDTPTGELREWLIAVATVR
nr:hypothetical protein DGKKSRWO_DGKKSRWO_CDS_0194 [uncultured phage]CAI9752372.1 hypothetical protein CVNMHQAP_CVNMHQAP_CDS_0195 [uncultured phage]